MSVSTLARWDLSTPVDLYVHFTKKGGVGVLAQGLPDKAQPVLWVVLQKPSCTFSPGLECLSNLVMKGRKLALRHLGIEPTKIYLPFRKQLSTQSIALSEYLAIALGGFGGEICYVAKPLGLSCSRLSTSTSHRKSWTDLNQDQQFSQMYLR